VNQLELKGRKIQKSSQNKEVKKFESTMDPNN
jgi:hypothetical protein